MSSTNQGTDQATVICSNPYQRIIGIDPGVKTGVAIYNAQWSYMELAASFTMLQAMAYLEKLTYRDRCFIRVEDARQRNWFGKSGREVLQGAGSIKRDCQLWEEFLTANGFAFELVPPKQNKTKLDAKTFRKITGWVGPTNEHSRDAGMLCFQFTPIKHQP